MFIENMFLNERPSFEELFAGLASVLALIFDNYMRLAEFGEFPIM